MSNITQDDYWTTPEECMYFANKAITMHIEPAIAKDISVQSMLRYIELLPTFVPIGFERDYHDVFGFPRRCWITYAGTRAEEVWKMFLRRNIYDNAKRYAHFQSGEFFMLKQPFYLVECLFRGLEFLHPATFVEYVNKSGSEYHLNLVILCDSEDDLAHSELADALIYNPLIISLDENSAFRSVFHSDRAYLREIYSYICMLSDLARGLTFEDTYHGPGKPETTQCSHPLLVARQMTDTASTFISITSIGENCVYDAIKQFFFYTKRRIYEPEQIFVSFAGSIPMSSSLSFAVRSIFPELNEPNKMYRCYCLSDDFSDYQEEFFEIRLLF